jgi:transposase-like protein
MVDVQTDKSQYYSFGKTKSGSQRYRCRLCKKTFSVGSPTLRQRKPHKNIQIFRLLVNKMPFKRICEVADVSMPTLYDKIEFIHRQCLSFVASRERKLLEGMPIRRLYLCVDRQDYLVNWTQREDKRNVQLSSVGCADNTTGYVFGLHPNFDPEQEWSTVEADAVKSGDYDMRYPFRKYPRLWLQGDYNDAMNRAYSKTYRFRADSLDKEIESTYEEVAERDDVEVPEMLDENTQLPSRGMLVHSEYALYGHFFFLKKLLSGVEKVRFFLDQESGIRAACLSAFVDEIKQQRCDAFYVRINKDLTVDQRKRVLAENRKEWAVLKREHPDLSDSALKLMIIKERMKKVRAIGKWQDRWVYHPFPNMSEPEKAVCYLTDNGQYDEDHIAWLYNKASLHAIDRFFMQVRRRISLLERPISTSSNPGRKWHGYSPYDPGMVIKLLDIFRVFYNYVEIGKDKETPASRLGLAKGKVDMEDILYFGG